MHAYPAQLAAAVAARWARLERLSDPGPCELRAGDLPDSTALEQLISIAYQASLLEEEARPVRFRILVGDPGRLPLDAGPPEGLQPLVFATPRPYDEQELRRLAPAAKYHRALIGVRQSGAGVFEIWGIVQSGPRWLLSVRGGRALPSPLPSDALVVRVAGPGLVAVGLGDVTLGELRVGQLQGVPLDAFDAEWLARRFAPFRAELAAEHDAALGPGAVPLDPNLIRQVSQHMFKRVIAILRETHHGATLLFVPDARVASLLGDEGTLRLKYAFADGAPRRRHRALFRAVMREVALAAAEAPSPPERAGWALFESSRRPSVAALDESILEVSHLIAALGDVDGAVVMTDRFELLGFGAEIAGRLPVIRTVRRALDLEGSASDLVPIDSVGTRHRSAYRLCSLERDAIAVVVSQDGAVQFVTWYEGGPTYWEHVPLAGSDP